MFVVDARPLTVLVVDDSRAPRLAVCAMLESHGHTTLEAADPDRALELFAEHRPDMVILDVEMPGHDGYWVARQIRAREAGGWTPIIFLSGLSDEHSLWNGIESGGDDYIAKPVSPVVLAAKLHAMQRLVRMRQRLQDLSEDLRQANAQLEHLSTVDPLTGLFNRRAFDQMLQREIDAGRRDARPLTLLLCDIDHFKRYNDSAGHLAGDACLKQVATVLKQVCRRPRDAAVRYGGEEFALLLPDTSRTGAMIFARALQRLLEAVALPHPDSPVGPIVTISGGFTTCVPDLDTNPNGMVLRADEALYTAKSRGRDRFFSFETKLDSRGEACESELATMAPLAPSVPNAAPAAA